MVEVLSLDDAASAGCRAVDSPQAGAFDIPGAESLPLPGPMLGPLYALRRAGPGLRPRAPHRLAGLRRSTGGTMTRRALLLAGLALGAVGCNSSTAVPEQTATVACGMCRFHMEGARSCFWAVELDGQHYAVVGANTPDHDSHGPDGMCVMDRQAVVAGRLKRGQFLADKFELLPAQGVDPSAAPAHEHVH